MGLHFFCNVQNLVWHEDMDPYSLVAAVQVTERTDLLMTAYREITHHVMQIQTICFLDV